jgi:hypothetical protein
MPAAAARCPLLLGRRPAAALRRSFRSSGARRVCAAAGGGGDGRSPAYGGLLLDAGGTLLQLARPVAETYAALGRPYGWGISQDNGFLFTCSHFIEHSAYAVRRSLIVFQV